MAALKLLNLIALVAIFALSSAPLPVNALVADRAQVARHIHGHDTFAKRKRSDSTSSTGLCKPRPSSATDYTPTSTPVPTTQYTTPSSASAPAPVSSSSSAAAAPSAASSSSGSSGKKWGLAWGASNTDLANFARPNIRFLYNWSPQKPDGLDALGIDFMAMLWGWNQVSSFQQLVVAGYAKYVLGMNEPNESTQANMSPQDGFNMWMQYINPLKDQGYTLISPACTNDDSGLQWYQQFFQLCNADSSCHVDMIAFHAYTTDPEYTIAYATWLNGNYTRDVIISEFADQNYSGTGGQPDMSQVWAYASTIVDFVNNTPWLFAAFPFGVMDDLQGVDTNNALLGSNGYPTSLGYYYFG
ncbi:glycosyl hydrolase catalytic core-domain-containing protein [Chiua virens]|nr:glycosyl hydrolase catalytic core-domain-containing protein [Chiua virens]